MSVPIHGSERHVCIIGIVLPRSKIFLLDFGTVRKMSAVCFIFHFISAKLFQSTNEYISILNTYVFIDIVVLWWYSSRTYVVTFFWLPFFAPVNEKNLV